MNSVGKTYTEYCTFLAVGTLNLSADRLRFARRYVANKKEDAINKTSSLFKKNIKAYCTCIFFVTI